jgi:Ni/Co efflux regulator RcnB
MRILSMIVALGLGAAFVVPAEAGFKFSARSGGGASFATMQRGGSFWGERRAYRPSGHRSGHRRHRNFSLFPHYGGYRDRDRERAPVAPTPAPVPPVAVVPAEHPPPPDPHGPLRLTPARGVAPVAAPYVLGQALPGNLPHVTLDWREFELPEPPPGRLYARVGRDVLVITATGRIVESVLPPG